MLGPPLFWPRKVSDVEMDKRNERRFWMLGAAAAAAAESKRGVHVQVARCRCVLLRVNKETTTAASNGTVLLVNISSSRIPAGVCMLYVCVGMCLAIIGTSLPPLCFSTYAHSIYMRARAGGCERRNCCSSFVRLLTGSSGGCTHPPATQRARARARTPRCQPGRSKSFFRAHHEHQ